MHRLITTRFSHYNEKARWVLDLLGVPYVEAAYVPMFHMAAVAWATRGSSDPAADAGSSRLSTPVLITENGQCICDSARIAR